MSVFTIQRDGGQIDRNDVSRNVLSTLDNQSEVTTGRMPVWGDGRDTVVVCRDNIMHLHGYRGDLSQRYIRNTRPALRNTARR